MTSAVLAEDLLGTRPVVSPRSVLLRDVATTLTGVGVIVGLAQIAIPLPFTPVPLTLATLGVVLVGAALGPARGLAATGIYLVAGMLGAPVFTGGGSGMAFASFGYVLGFLPAAAIVGWGARRGADRRVGGMLAAAVGATAVIYLVGVGWLMWWLSIPLAEAIRLGMLPFLAGDALKIGAAALALPGAWRLVSRMRA